MALDLNRIVEEIFDAGYDYHHCSRGWRDDSRSSSLRRYMEIPVKGDTFEIPVFALLPFMNALTNNENTDMLIAQLETYNHVSCYTSLNKVVEDVLRESFSRSALAKVKITKLETTYYGCYGAIFDAQFNPIMMCTWQVKRSHQRGQEDKFIFVKPIIRLAPECYLEQADALQRFLAKKLPTETLSMSLHYPSVGWHDSFLHMSDTHFHAKLVVDDIPFNIHEAETPSISTTNSELIQTAIDHIDEILPCQ